MIGYYVHHHGSGHLHRALALAPAIREACGMPVTGLSTLPRPADWSGSWVRLVPDLVDLPEDPTAGGQLHWAPLHADGVRRRAAALSAWAEAHLPRAVVVDVSVETTLLLRLHGVPVVSVVLPGRRTDAPHLTGLRAASALLATWPEAADAVDGVTMTPDLPLDLRERLVRVGAISRWPSAPVAGSSPPRGRRALLLQGRGGAATDTVSGTGLERAVPGWRWRVLGGGGEWLTDPRPALAEADVVVTRAGEGALADVAAARRPAVVVPDDRPFDEQHCTAEVLERGVWPALVRSSLTEALDTDVLDRAAGLDGRSWRSWCDGGAAQRAAEVVAGVALGGRGRSSLEVAT